jgi:hypothetical protein
MPLLKTGGSTKQYASTLSNHLPALVFSFDI